MKTGILFLIPPALPIKDLQASGIVQYKSYIPTSIPLGVLSISSYLKKHMDIDIRVIDFNVILNKYLSSDKSCAQIFEEQLTKIQEDFNPQIVGISALFNSNYSYLKMLSAAVKIYFPECIVITGGGLPTNLYKEVLTEAPDIDTVCLGEGEIPILNLMKAANQREFLNENDCWITREKLDGHFLQKSEYVIDLDEIPPFDYSLIDFSEYQKYNRYHGEGSEDSVATPMMTSRGCPFHCCFCASHSIHGKKIRTLSAERVLSDIDVLMEQYHVNTILFEDDHFFLNKPRALEILKGLCDKNLNIEFPNGIAVYSIDESIAQAIKDAGVTMATLAVESGSDYVLRNIIHKPLNLELVTKAVSLLRKKDIYIRAFFVIGFPGETEELRKETVEFIKKTGFNWVAIMIATPIAGSELYRICKDNQYLVSSNIEDLHFGKGNILTKDFTPEQIEKERYLINLDVNFINNYDLRHGNFDTALRGFHDVIKRVPDHAIAYYCMTECYSQKNDQEKAKSCMQKYIDIVNSDEKWRTYAEHFDLPVVLNH